MTLSESTSRRGDAETLKWLTHTLRRDHDLLVHNTTLFLPIKKKKKKKKEEKKKTATKLTASVLKQDPNTKGEKER